MDSRTIKRAYYPWSSWLRSSKSSPSAWNRGRTILQSLEVSIFKSYFSRSSWWLYISPLQIAVYLKSPSTRQNGCSAFTQWTSLIASLWKPIMLDFPKWRVEWSGPRGLTVWYASRWWLLNLALVISAQIPHIFFWLIYNFDLISIPETAN